MPKDKQERIHRGAVSRAGTAYVRSRTSSACQVCRARRTRCDNERPCSYCRRIGATCVSEPDSATAGFDPASLAILAQIEKLQDHVASLSDQLQGMRAQTRASTAETADQVQTSPTALSLHHHLQRGNIAQPLRWSNIWQPHEPPKGDDTEDTQDPVGSPSMSNGINPGPDRGFDLRLFGGYLDAFFLHMHGLNPVLDEQRLRSQLTSFLLNGVGWDAASCLLLLVLANGAFSSPLDSLSTPCEERPSDEQRWATAQALFDAAEKRKDTLWRADYLTQARCHFYSGVFMMVSMRPFDAWRYFLQGLASCQKLLIRSQRPRTLDIATVGNQAEESIYWSCWKSERELRFELDVPDFDSAEYHHPIMFPTLPQVTDQVEVRAWYFYLAEISLWRIEMTARQSMSEFAKAQPSALEGLVERMDDLEDLLASWHASLPDAIRLDDAGESDAEDVLLFVLRGRLTYNYEVLTWPFLETLLLFGEHRSPRATELAVRGVHVHYDRLTVNRRGFYYRHHGTWLMQRSSARSACVLLAVARSPHAGILPTGWVDLVSDTIAMLEYWSKNPENQVVVFLRSVFLETIQ